MGRSEELLKELDEYLMTNLYPTHKIVVREARDIYVYDVDGNAYLDFMTVVTTALLGHNPPGLADAIAETAKRLIAGNGYNWYTEELLNAAKAVLSLFPDKNLYNKVHFKLSGSEGIELALKIAKRYTKNTYIMYLMGGYHGRTYLTGSYHGMRRREYGPLPPGTLIAPFPYPYRCPFGDMPPEECGKAAVETIEYYINYVAIKDVCCLVTEPIQGVGGIVVPPMDFFERLKKVLDTYGILLIFDEVQSGMGRTGTTWAFEQFNVKPDIVVAAKGMTGGLPASAVVTRKEITSAMQLNDEHSTFGASAIIMAAVKATVDYYNMHKEELLSNAKKMGEYAMKRLMELYDKHPLIGDVRGLGLMIGIELVKNRKTKEPATKETSDICLNRALKRGVLFVTSGWNGNVIRFAPPLTVKQEHIDKAIEVLDKSLGEIEKEENIK